MSEIFRKERECLMLNSIKSVLSGAKAKAAGLGAALSAMMPASVAHAAGKSYNSVNDILGSGNTGASGVSSFAQMVMQFVSPLQTICTAILVCVAVILGLKIGAASVSGDPRSRTSSIVGLFFVVIGEFVIIHAQQVVAIVNTIK